MFWPGDDAIDFGVLLTNAAQMLQQTMHACRRNRISVLTISYRLHLCKFG
jgi:hypothetical protein